MGAACSRQGDKGVGKGNDGGGILVSPPLSPPGSPPRFLSPSTKASPGRQRGLRLDEDALADGGGRWWPSSPQQRAGDPGCSPGSPGGTKFLSLASPGRAILSLSRGMMPQGGQSSSSTCPALPVPRKEDLRGCEDILRDSLFEDVAAVRTASSSFYHATTSVVENHLYISKNLLALRGYEPLGPRALPALLYLCASKKIKVHKLTLESTGGGGVGLGAFIGSSRHLRDVSVVLEAMTDTEMGHLCSGLSYNSTLRRLRLVGRVFDAALASQLWLSLAQSPVREVALVCCSLGDEGLKHLANPLLSGGMRHLTKLDLCSCDIGDEGAERIASFCSQCNTLLSLNLCDNVIGSDGAGCLSQVVLGSTNCPLTSLNLSGNGRIGDEGTSAIASALRHNSALSCLKLCSCGIQDEGAMQLADALGHNQGIKRLELRRNAITSKGSVRLRAAFEGRVGGKPAPWHNGITVRLGSTASLSQLP